MNKKAKKRILCIITQSEFGGAQRYLLELISHLDKEKYDITIAAGQGGALLDALKAQNRQIWRLKHLARAINPIKDIRAYFELKNLIYAIKPDILQLLSTKAGILGSLAARRYKKNFSHFRSFASLSQFRIIYRIGGWSFLEDIPFWKKLLYTKAEKWTSKYKDKIIVNCEAHRQLGIKLKIAPAEKIITIYNGIDINKLSFLSYGNAIIKLLNNKNKETPKKGASSGSLKTRSLCSNELAPDINIIHQDKKLVKSQNVDEKIVKLLNCYIVNDATQCQGNNVTMSEPKANGSNITMEHYNTTGPKPELHSLYHNYQTKYTIGTVANFYKNKGLEYLIKAVSQLSTINYQLLIIGDGTERKNLENLIQNLNLEKKVILTGQIKNAHQYLKVFDIFVLPSIKEGQPWAILEAMSAGIPVIATNIAAIPEMIQDKKNGLLIEPKNPQQIAEKIEYLVKNPKIAENLGQNARQTIKQKFTIQKMIEETEKLY